MLPKPAKARVRADGRRQVRPADRDDHDDGARYRTTVAADEDPGYSGTAIMLGQSALALAFDGDTLPDAAGVLTPATGIGQPLVDRLRAHGFTFDCVRV